MNSVDLSKLLERARVKAQAGDAERWKPSGPGDAIAGEVNAIEEGGKFNCVDYTLQTENDNCVVSAAPDTVLGRKLHKLAIGDAVAIVYLGEKKSKSGRTYKDWSVVVDKKQSANSNGTNSSNGSDGDDLPF